ncbi:hypothetical protein [Catalinimonas alkaloidigena]|uniref:hypothetical protein n=1 Tax=Catalinimonas alkaloidigena TaxID=1075417 RepID=UPI000B7C9551|nr:hypothetical protein [Catalinimonas alkaloidigena]
MHALESCSFFSQSFVLEKNVSAFGGVHHWCIQQHHTLYLVLVDLGHRALPTEEIDTPVANLIRNHLNGNPVDLIHRITQHFAPTADEPYPFEVMVIKVSTSLRKVSFATTHRPIYFIRNQRLKRISTRTTSRERLSKSDVYSCRCKSGDVVYLSSGGFARLEGGPKNLSFGESNLEALLFNNHRNSFDVQHQYLQETMDTWLEHRRPHESVLILGAEF